MLEFYHHENDPRNHCRSFMKIQRQLQRDNKLQIDRWRVGEADRSSNHNVKQKLWKISSFSTRQNKMRIYHLSKHHYKHHRNHDLEMLWRTVHRHQSIEYVLLEVFWHRKHQDHNHRPKNRISMLKRDNCSHLHLHQQDWLEEILKGNSCTSLFKQLKIRLVDNVSISVDLQELEKARWYKKFYNNIPMIKLFESQQSIV